ncbi:MAG: hypothetical protein ABIF01_04925 [Candidatus Micrarchaeota archaeon]
MALKLKVDPDIEKRVATLEKMELRILRIERNLYYTLGALFGSLVFLSALFIPVLGRFSALGLTYAPPDPVATAAHLFMALFFISMVVCFYKGLILEKDIP